MAYPVMLNVQGRLCVVVGAGKVAGRKVDGLLSAGAHVVVVGIEPSAHIAQLASEKSIILHTRAFETADLEGCWLAFAATNDPLLNEQIGRLAKRMGVLFCHTGGGLGDFTTPAKLHKGDLTIGVSTNGSSPIYGRQVRDALDRYLTDDHGEVLALLKQLRLHLQENIKDANRRKEIWAGLMNENFFGDVQSGKLHDVKRRILKCL